MKIDCKFVQEHLSAWMDGELEGAFTDGVQQHLATCTSCARELVHFQKLNQLAHSFSADSSHIPLWEMIEQRMNLRTDGQVLKNCDSSKLGSIRIKSRLGSRPWRAIFGVAACFAATVLMIVIIGRPWATNRNSMDRSAVEQATNVSLNLQPVVEQFQSDPQASIRTLKKHYNLEDLSLADADESFGRLTYVSKYWNDDALPGSATPESTMLLSLSSCQCPKGKCTCGDGGCNCVVSVCRRPDGSIFLVFEQCQSQSVSFGNLPVKIVKRNGLEVQETWFRGVSAISFDWLSGKVVVVGLRSDSEVDSLFANNF